MDITLTNVAMCIMMEVVLIMMEVICITCGTVEFGLLCYAAQALAGIKGRGYHNPLKCSNIVNLRATQQGAFSHEAIAVCAPRARMSAPLPRTAAARTRRHALTK